MRIYRGSEVYLKMVLLGHTNILLKPTTPTMQLDPPAARCRTADWLLSEPPFSEGQFIFQGTES